jgi:Ricin-type beta-trefoil lectin domain
MYFFTLNPRRALALAGTVLAVVLGGATSAQAAVPGVATLRDLATGLTLDSNTSGNVYALPANGGSFQKWVVARSDFGTVTLRDLATSRCLDSNTNGDVYTLGCSGGSFQKWIVINRGFGTIVLRNLATGRVLDSNAWGEVYTLGENGGSYQKWIAASA